MCGGDALIRFMMSHYDSFLKDVTCNGVGKGRGAKNSLGGGQGFMEGRAFSVL